MKTLTEASLKWILGKIKKLELKDFDPDTLEISADGQTVTRSNGDFREVTHIESPSKIVVNAYNAGVLKETRIIKIQNKPNGSKNITETVDGVVKHRTTLNAAGNITTEYNENTKIVTEIVSENEIHEKTYNGDVLVSDKITQIVPDGSGGKIIQESIAGNHGGGGTN